MAIGKSGKVLIEIRPDLKQQLYVALQRDGLTMKDWFLQNARNYLASHRQPELVFSASPDLASDTRDGQ